MSAVQKMIFKLVPGGWLIFLWLIFFWVVWLIFFLVDFFYDWFWMIDFFCQSQKNHSQKIIYYKINHKSFTMNMWLIFLDDLSITSICDWFFILRGCQKQGKIFICVDNFGAVISLKQKFISNILWFKLPNITFDVQ